MCWYCPFRRPLLVAGDAHLGWFPRVPHCAAPSATIEDSTKKTETAEAILFFPMEQKLKWSFPGSTRTFIGQKRRRFFLIFDCSGASGGSFHELESRNFRFGYDQTMEGEDQSRSFRETRVGWLQIRGCLLSHHHQTVNTRVAGAFTHGMVIIGNHEKCQLKCRSARLVRWSLVNVK